MHNYNSTELCQFNQTATTLVYVCQCLLSVYLPTTPFPDQISREGAAPFVHDDDPRIYRPTVPGKGLSVEVPATPSSRTLVSRDSRRSISSFGEIGAEAKLAAMKEASRHSRLQMLANVEISRRSGQSVYHNDRCFFNPWEGGVRRSPYLILDRGEAEHALLLEQLREL